MISKYTKMYEYEKKNSRQTIELETAQNIFYIDVGCIVDYEKGRKYIDDFFIHSIMDIYGTDYTEEELKLLCPNYNQIIWNLL